MTHIAATLRPGDLDRVAMPFTCPSCRGGFQVETIRMFQPASGNPLKMQCNACASRHAEKVRNEFALRPDSEAAARSVAGMNEFDRKETLARWARLAEAGNPWEAAKWAAMVTLANRNRRGLDNGSNEDAMQRDNNNGGLRKWKR